MVMCLISFFSEISWLLMFCVPQMREDVNKGVYVEGLLEVEVQNVQDVLHLLLLVGATVISAMLVFTKFANLRIFSVQQENKMRP